MGKFSLTWNLMKSSLEVLKKDKEILIFPFISGICCILLIFPFVLPIIKNREIQITIIGHQDIHLWKYILIIFLFYYLIYLIMIFFNTAVVVAAHIKLNGGDPTVKDGFEGAIRIFPHIIVWSLFAAIAGLILRVLEERWVINGETAKGLLGLAWSLVSFLVIPILVVEKKGPFTALKESARMLKKTWGEQLIGHFSFGLVYFVFSIPAIILFVLGAVFNSQTVQVSLVILGIIYLLILALIQSAMQSIFKTVVYKYSRDKETPGSFREQDIISAFGAKKAPSLPITKG